MTLPMHINASNLSYLICYDNLPLKICGVKYGISLQSLTMDNNAQRRLTKLIILLVGPCHRTTSKYTYPIANVPPWLYFSTFRGAHNTSLLQFISGQYGSGHYRLWGSSRPASTSSGLTQRLCQLSGLALTTGGV